MNCFCSPPTDAIGPEVEFLISFCSRWQMIARKEKERTWKQEIMGILQLKWQKFFPA